MRENQIVHQYFKGRTLVIATKHKKEKVLAPVLSEALGVNVIVADNLDTDDFGTFSGEVERNNSPLETARLKCDEARKLTGENLIVASEGSFGAHPTMCFVPADEEILVMKDYLNDTEYKVKTISTQTNFNGNEYYEWQHVLFFASQVNFPSHALIVRRSRTDYTEIHKGITDWNALKESFMYFKKKFGRAFIETDMRAMHNPTRMKVIEEAALKLKETIYTLCPVCEMPGFQVYETIKGLPCNQCNEPTRTPKEMIRICSRCGHSEKKAFREGKITEDAMFCDQCNP